MSMAEQFNGDSLLEMFLFETSQNTEQLEKIILDTEKDGKFSEESINEIFRIMHTIKGSAAMMSFSNISSLAHKAEDLFYIIRDNPSVDYDCSNISDIILSCMDYINSEMEKIKNNEEADISGGEILIRKVENCLNEISKGEVSRPDKNKSNTAEKRNTVITEDTAKSGHNSYHVTLFFDDGCEMENIRAYSIVREMDSYAENIKYRPDDIIDNDDTVLVIRKNGFKISFNSAKTFQEIYSIFEKTPFIKDIDLVEGATAESRGNQSSKANGKTESAPVSDNGAKSNKQEEVKTTDNHSSVQSIISVNISKLDKLMDLVGEIVIAESMVVENPDLRGLELPAFQREAQQLHKIIVEMQDLVMSLRLVPLATTFQKTHRIVRDMTKKLGKEAVIQLVGEDTEVDKNIIEHLSDPLLHLVRNCIDHGIESEEERIAAGKPALGTVTIEAFNAGSNVYIIVRDDGRGINKIKVLEKAKRQNLLKKPESEMTDKEIYSLIFLPGFSTNDTISEYSGRGVGMDVVMQNILSIGGSLSVDSEEGKGMSVTMKIPLTVAIIEGMGILVGNRHFTIPISAIKESFKPSAENLFKDTDGNEMIMVRGECYAVMRLHKQWGIEAEAKELTDGILIMIEQDDKKRCIFVDSLLGQQQVVVKTMPDLIKKIKTVVGLSGCTLLGDGSISLIIDAGWLVNTDIK
jgi:two-component system chemotaxis sensor kinase CheA